MLLLVLRGQKRLRRVEKAFLRILFPRDPRGVVWGEVVRHKLVVFVDVVELYGERGERQVLQLEEAVFVEEGHWSSETITCTELIRIPL
jgi:hypothetical protein